LPGAALLALGIWAGDARLLAAIGGMVLILFGELVAILWYVLRFLVTAQVVASEDVGPVAALRRSNGLISGQVGPGLGGWVKLRATILLTAVMLIRSIVGVIAGLPAIAIQFAYGHAFGAEQDLTAIPQALLVPAELISVFAQAVFRPLFLVFGAMFYLDMCVRREGLDLELKLRAPRAA
jgi:hypothetical protein